MPICSTCNDTHRMPLGDGIAMCTRCPTPCRDCASHGGAGAYCGATPCPCECHRDPAAQLGALLRDAGLRPTFDRARNVTHPCVLCGTTIEQRELVEIGVYTRHMGGGLEPGDKIIRPLCKRCEELTR